MLFQKLGIYATLWGTLARAAQVNNPFDDLPVEGEVSARAGSSPEIRPVSLDSKFTNYVYLPPTPKYRDESVLAWTEEGQLYLKENSASKPNWQRTPYDDVVSVMVSDTPEKQVYLYRRSTVSTKTVEISRDQGRSFESLTLPSAPQVLFGMVPEFLEFFPGKPELVLFNGRSASAADCDDVFGCPTGTYLSKTGTGKGNWVSLYDGECHWFKREESDSKTGSEETVYCFNRNNNASNPLDRAIANDILWSKDYFQTEPHKVEGLENVVAVIPASRFLIGVSVNLTSSKANLKVSSDGLTFDDVELPSNIPVSKFGETLLTFDENSIWLFEPANEQSDDIFGTILKSDSSGTEYISVLENVNRASGAFAGYVDFDRIENVEGVALANVVKNPKDVLFGGAKKEIQTLITHSDGALWAPLKLEDGQTLNLHGFTERLDFRNKPTSQFAPGVIIGRGNVGETLGAYRTSHTYMTRDAGLTWKEIYAGPAFWEIADAGQVIVLVDSLEPTNKITYSVDGGETWSSMAISEDNLQIKKLLALPYDSTAKFMIFADPPLSKGDSSLAIEIDFANILSKKQCASKSTEWWAPEHPQLKTKCMLGHEVQYLRKKSGEDCRMGILNRPDELVPGYKRIGKTCECTVNDYECDLGFTRNDKGECVSITGLKNPTKEEQCSNGASTWRDTSGYRKVAASTCEGGLQINSGKSYPCSGKEESGKPQQPVPPSNGNNDDNKNNNGNGNNNGNNNGGKNKKADRRSLLSGIFYLFFGGSLGLLIVFGLVKLELIKSPSTVRLPDNEFVNSTARQSAGAAGKILGQAKDIWQLIRANIPLFGSRIPQDHMGFYSRMGDDERYSGFESDGFEEDESAGEDAVFQDEDDHDDEIVGRSRSPEDLP